MSSYRTFAAVLAAISMSGAAFAQAPALNGPPVNMVPASQGGTLPPGFGMPIQQPAPQVQVPVQPSQLFQGAQPAQVQMQPPSQQVQPNGQPLPQVIPGPGQPGREAILNDSFVRALEGLMPLSPGQFGTTRREADARSSAAARPGTMPTPITRTVNLTLRPGETLPVINAYAGNATTLTFADGTGAAWPVLSVTTGNPAAFKAEQAGPQGTSNIVVISPLLQHTYATNLVITLVGSPVPITMSLQSGGPTVDFRVDIGLRGRGPNAQTETTGIATLSPTADATMQAFVDGVPPQGARRMTSSRSDVEVWRMGDAIYVRSALELLSPAPIARANHVSGVKVFSLVHTPVLVLSQNGIQVRVNVDERTAGARR